MKPFVVKLPLNATCLDAERRPKEIPLEKWLVKDKEYTVIDIQFLQSRNEVGFRLKEITLDESCFPYHYFSSLRFGITLKDLEQEHNVELNTLEHVTN